MLDLHAWAVTQACSTVQQQAIVSQVRFIWNTCVLMTDTECAAVFGGPTALWEWLQGTGLGWGALTLALLLIKPLSEVALRKLRANAGTAWDAPSRPNERRREMKALELVAFLLHNMRCGWWPAETGLISDLRCRSEMSWCYEVRQGKMRGHDQFL